VAYFEHHTCDADILRCAFYDLIYSGSIKTIIWSQEEEGGGLPEHQQDELKPGTYVRVYGTLRSLEVRFGSFATTECRACCHFANCCLHRATPTSLHFA
jgi:hypothetical protein